MYSLSKNAEEKKLLSVIDDVKSDKLAKKLREDISTRASIPSLYPHSAELRNYIINLVVGGELKSLSEKQMYVFARSIQENCLMEGFIVDPFVKNSFSLVNRKGFLYTLSNLFEHSLAGGGIKEGVKDDFLRRLYLTYPLPSTSEVKEEKRRYFSLVKNCLDIGYTLLANSLLETVSSVSFGTFEDITDDLARSVFPRLSNKAEKLLLAISPLPITNAYFTPAKLNRIINELKSDVMLVCENKDIIRNDDILLIWDDVQREVNRLLRKKMIGNLADMVSEY